MGRQNPLRGLQGVEMSLGDLAKPAAATGLTRFIVDLMKMSPDNRAKASAEKAAERYGIRQDWADWWINEARRSDEVWPVRNGGVRK